MSVLAIALSLPSLFYQCFAGLPCHGIHVIGGPVIDVVYKMRWRLPVSDDS
jgi:hypothetical protein